jgi:hypothetical protein
MNKLKICGETCSIEKLLSDDKSLGLILAKEDGGQTVYSFKTLKDRPKIRMDIGQGSIMMGFYSTALRKAQTK